MYIYTIHNLFRKNILEIYLLYSIFYYLLYIPILEIMNSYFLSVKLGVLKIFGAIKINSRKQTFLSFNIQL